MQHPWHKSGIYLKIPEMIVPSHSALLVIDMQNDFCSSGGACDVLGQDISSVSAMVPALRRLIEAARQAGATVIYLQNTNLPGGRSSSPAELARRFRFGVSPDITLADSWGAQIIPELAPLSEEAIIHKHRPSGFVGTDLDLILRSNAIETVIVAGVVSYGCVFSTAREAVFHNYYSVVVEDCIASSRADLHAAALLLLKNGVHALTNSTEIQRIWRDLES